jgi:heterodisulfide reductase subunit B
MSDNSENFDSIYTFNCECGGLVYPQTNSKMKWKISTGKVVMVPDTMSIPKCSKCGDCYTDGPLADAISIALGDEL